MVLHRALAVGAVHRNPGGLGVQTMAHSICECFRDSTLRILYSIVATMLLAICQWLTDYL
ncbi:hypothetical protein DAEQUDRAFT_730782, partial [Daedalea quercina L-15889]